MKRIFQHIILMILALTGAGWEAYAQTLPDLSWTLVQVSENSIHSYTVTGDRNMATPSDFVWVVNGGTLYTDATALTIAGDGTTVRVNGDGGNISTLYIKWDGGPGAGYVYAYEVSSFGCEQPVVLQSKYTGIRVNKAVEATARFLADATDYCSDDGGTFLGIELKGLAPFQLTYHIDGIPQTTITIQQSDLKDLDLDGEIDDYELLVPGWAGVTTDKNVVFMIETISSDGTVGTIGTFTTHTVYVHPLPIIKDIKF
ncbi:hypothetical protein [Marinifilum flexuosum]|uniref:hypothetical protein n=1 Tax=Marinifilum flexuosum TaxID=1117708 RepID=UPI0024914BC3|nr:hypothetical protein [Marinifilum flexuosum]